MTVSPLETLAEAVALYDARPAPVTPVALAEALDADVDTIRAYVNDFESNHLLQRVNGGYRPTVTARELLELDIDTETALILDPEPET